MILIPSSPLPTKRSAWKHESPKPCCKQKKQATNATCLEPYQTTLVKMNFYPYSSQRHIQRISQPLLLGKKKVVVTAAPFWEEWRAWSASQTWPGLFYLPGAQERDITKKLPSQVWPTDNCFFWQQWGSNKKSIDNQEGFQEHKLCSLLCCQLKGMMEQERRKWHRWTPGLKTAATSRILGGLTMVLLIQHQNCW